LSAAQKQTNNTEHKTKKKHTRANNRIVKETVTGTGNAIRKKKSYRIETFFTTTCKKKFT
jgi:hypothetical protein